MHNTSRMTALLSLLVGLGLAACGPEPVEFDPNGNGPETAGNNANNAEEDAEDEGEDLSPGQDAETPEEDLENPEPQDMPDNGVETMVVIEPDRELFASSVNPILSRNCSTAGCHAYNGGRTYHLHPEDPLDEEQLTFNIEQTVEWTDFENPRESRIFAFMVGDESHPIPYVLNGPEYSALYEWMQASVKIIEIRPDGEDLPDVDEPDVEDAEDLPDVDPEPPLVPCDALPDPGALPGNLDYDKYKEHVNPMLLQRCTTAQGCHGVQNPEFGGNLWLIRDEDDDCYQRWNFLTTTWFVNYAEPLRSPLLLEPLGQQALGSYHGGRNVFSGTVDCDYILLKSWIEGALEEPLGPPACVD